MPADLANRRSLACQQDLLMTVGRLSANPDRVTQVVRANRSHFLYKRGSAAVKNSEVKYLSFF